MFDIGWPELFVIAAVTLIVVGPKDLPRVLRTGARILNKARAMSREFQMNLADIAREAELDDIKRKVEKAARFDPGDELRKAVDPTGKLSADFDPAEFNRKLKDAVESGPPTGPATAPDIPAPAAVPVATAAPDPGGAAADLARPAAPTPAAPTPAAPTPAAPTPDVRASDVPAPDVPAPDVPAPDVPAPRVASSAAAAPDAPPGQPR